MKVCSAFIALALMICFFGCGGDEEAATSADGLSRERTTTEVTQDQQEPDYPLPRLPAKRAPLQKLYVKDLVVGRGPVARWGDEVMVRHVAVYWKTGKIFTQHWGYATGHKLERRRDDHGWMTGLLGLRVGGRRELRIPSDLLYEAGDAAYIVTINKIKPGAAEKGQ